MIGRGGSALLHRARDLRLERVVALKRMDRERWDPEARRRFAQEARTLAALRHSNLVTVYDVGEDDDGVPFLVMELLEGRSLAAALPSRPSCAQVLEWVFPILGALAFVHEHGIVHRDVKPSNVFLERRGDRERAVLLDFGIARRSGWSGHASAAAGSTDETTLVGTPAYLAPERIRGGPLTPAADVWSMGVMLFEAFSGRLPFGAPTRTRWSKPSCETRRLRWRASPTCRVPSRWPSTARFAPSSVATPPCARWRERFSKRRWPAASRCRPPPMPSGSPSGSRGGPKRRGWMPRRTARTPGLHRRQRLSRGGVGGLGTHRCRSRTRRGLSGGVQWSREASRRRSSSARRSSRRSRRCSTPGDARVDEGSRSRALASPCAWPAPHRRDGADGERSHRAKNDSRTPTLFGSRPRTTTRRRAPRTAEDSRPRRSTRDPQKTHATRRRRAEQPRPRRPTAPT
ncbi:MAG: serine/threonine protein kinase [Sandaracinus sp.]|nr:serine/threonine protein kinase [Sandaracinus sp.]